MKKFIATLALVVFTVVLTSYNNNTGDDQIAGDNNSTQLQEPGGAVSGGTVGNDNGGL